MAEAIRDKLKKEQFVLVDSDFLRKLKENGEVRVEAEYNTCMTVTGDPNLITVFQFVKDLVRYIHMFYSLISKPFSVYIYESLDWHVFICYGHEKVK